MCVMCVCDVCVMCVCVCVCVIARVCPGMASPEDASLSLEADIPEGKVTLMSKDGQTFPNVDKRHASMSKLVRNVLEGDPHADAIPILGVEAAVLRLVVDYMQHHKSQPIATIATPLRGTDLSTLTSAFDAKLMMDCASDHLVFDIIDAANYMEIPRLVELGQAKVASLLKGRPLHEMQDVLTTLAGARLSLSFGRDLPASALSISLFVLLFCLPACPSHTLLLLVLSLFLSGGTCASLSVRLCVRVCVCVCVCVPLSHYLSLSLSLSLSHYLSLSLSLSLSPSLARVRVCVLV